MSRDGKTRASTKRCSEVTGDKEDALVDYKDIPLPASGKYRCRECGKLFDTLEEHDKHYRNYHLRTPIQSTQGMTM